MATLWLPPAARTPEPKVSPEHIETTREWEAQVLASMQQTGGILDHWTAVLKDVDPELRLMQAHENAHCAGVMAGFYHLVRLRNPMRNEQLLVVPLRGPSGEFIEPSSQMLDALRMCDLQNEQINRKRQADALAEEASLLRARMREDECRVDEGVERFLASSRTQVLMSRDVPWAQNNSAAARRDKGARRKRR